MPVRRGTVLLTALLLSACLPGASAPPLYKLGLVAPFEGYHRPLGYRVLGPVREALAGWAGHPDRPDVGLVALDDQLDGEQTARRARELGLDPAVVAVIGPWTREAAQAAAPAFEGEGLPLLVPVPLLEAPPEAWIVSAAPDGEVVVRSALGWLEEVGASELLAVGGPLAARVRIRAGLPDAAGPGDASAVVLDLDPEAAARWLRGEGREWDRERVLGMPALHSEKLLLLAGEAALGMGVLAVEGVPDPWSAQARRAAEAALRALEGDAVSREEVRARLQPEIAPLLVYRVRGLDYPVGLAAEGR